MYVIARNVSDDCNCIIEGEVYEVLPTSDEEGDFSIVVSAGHHITCYWSDDPDCEWVMVEPEPTMLRLVRR